MGYSMVGVVCDPKTLNPNPYNPLSWFPVRSALNDSVLFCLS